MKKNKNAGFSIVEILIALAIFLILMLPIVNGIIQALNMSTGSKELQYRNEFAEGIMEHVKSVNINDLQDSKFYLNEGTIPGTFDTTKNLYITDTTDPDYAGTPFQNDLNGDGKITADEIFEYAEYQITGSVELGTKHEKYNYLVDVSSKAYAEAKSNDTSGTFLDPNNLSLGIIEDIDYTKVALIDDQVFNYDAMAENALKAKKLQGLKDSGDEEAYRQALENSANVFAQDEGTRMMTIKISGDATDGYKVRCILDYYDDNGVLGTDSNHYVEYSPYGKTFKDGMPNIYVLYNPCHYNSNYVLDDYISIDISELDDTKSKVNVFLVEVASTFSDTIVDSGALEEANKVDEKRQFTAGQSLYNTEYKNFGHRRDDAYIHVGAIVNGTDSSRLRQLQLYTNIGNNTKLVMNESGSYDEVEKSNKKSASDKLLYSIDDGCVDTQMSDFFDYMKENNIPDTVYPKLYSLYGHAYNALVGGLDDASAESRGMYDVKVYLKKEENGVIQVDQDVPILEGTKGGNES